ncbi:TaqI-like C-terminal specificity domain-containing protein [Deinococcus sp. PEB2-63]
MWGIGNKIYRGVLTGCNDAFIISAATRQELIDADAKSAEIIKPLAVGDDVRRWHVRDKGRYLIFARRGIDISKYPAIRKHLEHYQEQLEPRPRNWPSGKSWSGRKPGSYKWYEIQDDVAYFREFDKPKIIYPDMAQEPRFTLDTTGYYFGNTTYLIANADLYLLGILNSQPFWSLCQQKFAVFKGATLRFFKQDLLQLPIPLPTPEQRTLMETWVTRCLEANGTDCQEWETAINSLASALYEID